MRRVFSGALGALVVLLAAVALLAPDFVWLLTYGPLALAAWTLLALVLVAGLLTAAARYDDRCARARRRSRGIPVAVLPPELPDADQWGEIA